MEEELREQEGKRNRVEALMAQINEISEHYQSKLDLKDRITTYCTELMDDLLIVDHENLELSTYRLPIHDIRQSIQDFWMKIEASYVNITRDIEFLKTNIDSINPQLVEFWWLVSEELQKSLQRIRDQFFDFFELQLKFKEFIQVLSEKFKDDPHFIFERYRHFSDW